MGPRGRRRLPAPLPLTFLGAALAGLPGGPGTLEAQGPVPPPWSLGPPVAGRLPHEPIFGVGPHTMYRGGIGIEVELESQGGELVLPLEILYGVTEHLSLTGVLPYRNPTRGGSLGDVGLRAKWRIAVGYRAGRLDGLALLGGVTLPRASSPVAPRGGPVFMAGVAAGSEDRRWYYFGGIRGFLRTARRGFDPGERLAVDVAWGVRPWLTEYLAPDLVVLLEANLRVEGRTRNGGTPLPGSGGRVLSVGPAALLSYRNVMLKAGFDVPVLEALNDPERSAATKLVGAVEVHF